MIELRKMSKEEYKDFIAYCVPEYAREKMKAEDLSEDYALQLAEESFRELLPQGVDSDNHFLFSVIHQPMALIVGALWFARLRRGNKSYAFIYDIVINKEVRGKGFGKKVMELAEIEIRNLGLSQIGLHVFGHNKTAIQLYEKLGYQVTNINMMKTVADG